MTLPLIKQQQHHRRDAPIWAFREKLMKFINKIAPPIVREAVNSHIQNCSIEQLQSIREELRDLVE
jgi:hypothetical protein